MNTTPPPSGSQFFSNKHRKYLADRAISGELAQKARWQSVSAKEGAMLLGFKNPLASAGLATVYIDDGEVVGYRIRLDDPGVDENGKSKAKCLAQKGHANPYIPPPTVVSPERWQDISEPLHIVESPAKALALCQAGFLAIGLGGVSAGGHDAQLYKKTRELRIHPLLDKNVVFTGRKVVIIFDAGRDNNAMVANAEAIKAMALTNGGANVMVAALPLLAGGGDQGPDDFIAANGKDAFKEIIDAALPADPIERIAQLKGLPREQRAEAGEALIDDLPFLAGLHRAGKKTIDRAAKRLKANADINKSTTKEAVEDFAGSLSAKASKGGQDGKPQGKMSQGTLIVTLLRDDLDLFHGPDDKAHCLVLPDHRSGFRSLASS